MGQPDSELPIAESGAASVLLGAAGQVLDLPGAGQHALDRMRRTAAHAHVLFTLSPHNLHTGSVKLEQACQ